MKKDKTPRTGRVQYWMRYRDNFVTLPHLAFKFETNVPLFAKKQF
jgi:hypothetical protein